MGPSLLLKVMSGDKIDIAVQSFYNTGTTSTPNSSLTDVLASLATGVVNMTAGGKGSITDLNNQTSSPIYAALNSFLPTDDPNQTTKPKAYLNWILLDDQLKYVSSYPQSGATVVGSAGTLNTIGYTGLPITKNGFLYIWVSNETPNWDAFFDNLVVKQYAGPLLEENHYYPFGLTMAAISSKALKPFYAENKYRFNDGTELANKEFSDGSGLEMYETDFRGYDPQIGRFWQIDPLGETTESWSCYSFVQNNPTLYNDPFGLDTSKVNIPLPAGTKPETLIPVSSPTGGTSMYIYRPDDPNADADGFVSAGMVSPQLQSITVTPTGNSLDPPTSSGTTGASDGGSGKHLPGEFDQSDAEIGLNKVKEEYGRDMAATVEKLTRFETNNYSSAQFTNTGTGGMEAHGGPPNYGWNPSFFQANPQYIPSGTWSAFENSGLSGQGGNAQVTNRPKQFVVMPSVEAAFMFNADYIKRNGGNYARWFSTNTKAQALYRTKIEAIKPAITNGLK